jgi:hypothetical protein
MSLRCDQCSACECAEPGAVEAATRADVERTSGAPAALIARAVMLAEILDRSAPSTPGLAATARQHAVAMEEIEKHARPVVLSAPDQIRARRERRAARRKAASE